MTLPEQSVGGTPELTDSTTTKRSISDVFFAIGTLIVIGIVLILLLPATGGGSRPASRRSQCKNNLKQIGLALRNYHDQYGCFPPAFVADELGRPMHSWRVLLLPYLDQAPLYKEYRFDEPWDGPNNRKLASTVLSIYCCPSEEVEKGSPESLYTSYVAVVGPETAWPGATSTRIKDFKDGTSNCLLIVESAHSGIHWMEPRDLHVLQMSSTINSAAGQGISSRHTGGAHALIADGAVRFLSENLSAETIRALLTIKGGEVIPSDF